MRRWTVSLVAALLVSAGLVGLAGWQYISFTRTPLRIQQEIVIQVERGTTMGSVVAGLESRGVTRTGWRWKLFNRLHPVTIRAGEYALAPGLVPGELLRKLASGDVVEHAFTIVEGWTFARLVRALAGNTVLTAEFGIGGDPDRLMADLGMPGMQPEGWFLPETYYFLRGDSDTDILRRAHLAMREALEAAWEQRADVPLNAPYELLILASIVEKETAQADERPAIAGVLTRRLERGWRLETDPTVIYGLGESFDGDLRTRDLRTDTPYNTYTRHGLPPTPIALPGRDALFACARPARGSAMFFVADGHGGHVFSDTLADHQKAVRRMLDKQP